jgi:hypothetical protein
MAGYLDQYGAGEEKREHLIRNSVIIALTVLVLGSLFYYLFRTYHQARVTKRFLELVGKKDYQAAYAAWGCGSPTACPGYDYNKFLEDWGPKSPAASSPALRITDTESCNTGVIVTVSVAPGDQQKLWIEKNSDALSYAPVPVCPGKGPWAIMLHRTVGRLRQIFF